MPRVSRIKVEPERLGFFLNNFWNLITLLENKDEVKNCLKDLLTHTEMKMLAKRVQIAKMLAEGYNYKDIKAAVRVTDPTIARISNILSVEGSGLWKIVQHLQRVEEKIEKERMRVAPELKKISGIHFTPQKVLERVNESLKKRARRNSVRKKILL